LKMMGGTIMSKGGLRQETGHAFLVPVLRIMFGAIILAAGTEHFLGGQAGFAFLGFIGTPIGSWVAANVSFMWPLVFISMWLTGLSLIFGLLARLGSVVLFLYAFFFILGVNSWIGNVAMLGTAIGFIIIGPGRYYGLDSYLLQRYKWLRIFA